MFFPFCDNYFCGVCGAYRQFIDDGALCRAERGQGGLGMGVPVARSHPSWLNGLGSLGWGYEIYACWSFSVSRWVGDRSGVAAILSELGGFLFSREIAPSLRSGADAVGLLISPLRDECHAPVPLPWEMGELSPGAVGAERDPRAGSAAGSAGIELNFARGRRGCCSCFLCY